MYDNEICYDYFLLEGLLQEDTIVYGSNFVLPDGIIYLFYYIIIHYDLALYWHAIVRATKVKFDLLMDYNKILLIEKRIRRGSSKNMHKRIINV